MKKILEYTTTTFTIVTILSFIFAVGAIDGGYNGVPMNDNWVAFAVCTTIGLVSMGIAILSQIKYQEVK